LKGNTTLLLNTTKEEKEHFYKLQEYNDTFLLDERTLDMKNRKYIADNIKGTKINITNNQGIIFVAGNRDNCLIHSEPKMDGNRMFLSILPCSKEDMSYMENKNYIDTYDVKSIAHIMFNKNMKKGEINLDKFIFPNNIIDVYWYEEGENDVKPKKIKKKYIFFYFFRLKISLIFFTVAIYRKNII
jgi:hypothetical protein